MNLMSSNDIDEDSRPQQYIPHTAYVIFDVETVPDGDLIKQTRFPEESLSFTSAQAIEKYRQELIEQRSNGSDFIPFTYQLPVAIAVVRVATDFTIQACSCLDTPQYRTENMVRTFWRGVEKYEDARFVTFNGRNFDFPVLELAAFRYSISNANYFGEGRNRYKGIGIDLMDFITNFGATRLTGGLDVLAKMVQKPGKVQVAGNDVYHLYLQNKLQEINDYCLWDALDTYFVFLRTRILLGRIKPEQETQLIAKARAFLESKALEYPSLRTYLANWK